MDIMGQSSANPCLQQQMPIYTFRGSTISCLGLERAKKFCEQQHLLPPRKLQILLLIDLLPILEQLQDVRVSLEGMHAIWQALT